MKFLSSAFIGLSLIVGNVSSASAQFDVVNFAKQQNAQTVREITVIGNRRVEIATVRSYADVRVGDRVSKDQLDQILDNIYESGLFSDVKVAFDNGLLILTVDENQVISDVSFSGNDKISDEDLEKEITLVARKTFTKAAVQADTQRILDLYRIKGRFDAEVTPKIVNKPQNRVALIYEINEGVRSRIKNISFVGNQAFNESKLKGTILTEESAWYKLLGAQDNYDEDRLEYDKELLRKFYLSEGYADFAVTDVATEYKPELSEFEIVFTVNEGMRYNFGESTISANIQDVNVDDLTGLIASKAGTHYNADLVRETTDAISGELGDIGYAFTDINTKLNRDKENGIINVAYNISEGPRVYVNRINIEGNVRTLDEVIRREIKVAEGDPYNTSKVKLSERRVNNLGFFSKARIQPKRVAGYDDKIDLNVGLEEKSTGSLTFGAGFSSTDGALGEISLSENNLLGTGQKLNLNLRLSSVNQQYELGFTEPRFLGYDVSAGFDLFRTERNKASSLSNRSYDNRSTGGSLRLGYKISENLSHLIKYTYRSDEITNIDAGASSFILAQAGKTDTSTISNTFIYDTRDNRFLPNQGWLVRYGIDFAGLGGDAKFVRNQLTVSYYTPVYFEDVILKLSTTAGHITGWDEDDVRIQHRFFLGGNDLRGFKRDGVGPRDTATNDPLGGNVYGTATAEVLFPLGEWAEELGFKGAVFGDAGYLVDPDETGVFHNDDTVRTSAGLGLAWQSPLGPLRLDYAWPITSEDYDQEERFKFSFGTRF